MSKEIITKGMEDSTGLATSATGDVQSGLSTDMFTGILATLATVDDCR